MTELAAIPLTASARRALADAGFTTLEDVASRTREEIAALRGVGPSAMTNLDRELAAHGLRFGMGVGTDVERSTTESAEAIEPDEEIIDVEIVDERTASPIEVMETDATTPTATDEPAQSTEVTTPEELAADAAVDTAPADSVAPSAPAAEEPSAGAGVTPDPAAAAAAEETPSAAAATEETPSASAAAQETPSASASGTSTYYGPTIQGAPATAPAGTPAAAADPGYNPLSIIALLLLIAFPPASIVVGHIALSQHKKTAQKGREMALIGTILGYVFTAIALLVFLFITVMVALSFTAVIGTILDPTVSPDTWGPGDYGPGRFDDNWRRI